MEAVRELLDLETLSFWLKFKITFEVFLAVVVAPLVFRFIWESHKRRKEFEAEWDARKKEHRWPY